MEENGQPAEDDWWRYYGLSKSATTANTKDHYDQGQFALWVGVVGQKPGGINCPFLAGQVLNALRGISESVRRLPL